MKRIAIIVEQIETFVPNYYLCTMSQRWTQRGYKVKAVTPHSPFYEADLAFLHVDLTRVPGEFLDLAKKYPRTVNSRVVDTSKRLTSRHVLDGPEEYDGAVFVKSNMNSGGTREAAYARAGRLPPQLAAAATPYQKFECACDVPRAIWDDPLQVVERYAPEMHDGLYSNRYWVFCGDREMTTIAFSRDPIIKRKNMVRREIVEGVPPELRVLRQELGFEYGKFDYTMTESGPVMFDANRTPTLGRMAPCPILEKLLETLQGGLESFLTR